MSELSVKDAAELLKVSEKTVYRWIRQGVVPTFKFQGQYRFDKTELQDWARYKRIGSVVETADSSEEGTESLLPMALQRGGVHYKLEGDTVDKVLKQAVQVFPLRPGTSEELREALIKTLLEREGLVSTGIGKGVAIPHPRHPRDWGLGGPALGVFFLEQDVDFKAIDGAPVFVLFMLLCPTVQTHLQMLSQVSHLVNHVEMQQFLRTHPKRSELMEAVANAFPETV